jgi:hypothetical protein
MTAVRIAEIVFVVIVTVTILVFQQIELTTSKNKEGAKMDYWECPECHVSNPYDGVRCWGCNSTPPVSNTGAETAA